jgi:hypothetical protein
MNTTMECLSTHAHALPAFWWISPVGTVCVLNTLPLNTNRTYFLTACFTQTCTSVTLQMSRTMDETPRQYKHKQHCSGCTREGTTGWTQVFVLSQHSTSPSTSTSTTKLQQCNCFASPWTSSRAPSVPPRQSRNPLHLPIPQSGASSSKSSSRQTKARLKEATLGLRKLLQVTTPSPTTSQQQRLCALNESSSVHTLLSQPDTHLMTVHGPIRQVLLHI